MWRLGFALFALGALQQTDVLPRFETGVPPPLPERVAAGGEVLLEVTVSPQGEVEDIVRIRHTPPYTDLLERAVRSWSFEPARSEEGPEPSRVLVAGMFRPPAFYIGTTAGEPPESLATPSSEVVFPEQMIPPAYPPNGHGDAVVLIEALVDASGEVAEAKVSGDGSSFAGAALNAVRQWRFRPARPRGAPAPGIAIVVVGFRQPVVPS